MEVREIKFNAPNVPRLGDPRRVPSHAYLNWGLPLGSYRHQSDELYRSEWEGGSPKQVQVVVDAIVQSGLGNFSQMLRSINAKIVSHLVSRSRSRINYLESGAGISTVNLYEELGRIGTDLQKIHSVLVEPSRERVEAAADKLRAMGLREGINFVVIVDKDVNVLSHVPEASQDIVSTVATLHHHAYLDAPLTELSKVLARDGILIIADWHNSMWEHPARVCQALSEDFEWPSKAEDLDVFRRAYPKSLEVLPDITSPEDAAANRMIRQFWISYAKIKAAEIANGTFTERDDILMLEGHRPVERQIEEMKKLGFHFDSLLISALIEALNLNGNPHQLLTDSRLLMLTIGQKV